MNEKRKASASRALRRLMTGKPHEQENAAILTRLRDKNPHPTTELNFHSPFELLIAVLLSAQATDVSVNKATPCSIRSPIRRRLLALGVEGVKSYIKTIGLFNSKAENVIKTCRILLEQHNGEVPEDRAALEALPGVGRKTRERGTEYRVWLADDRRGYAYLPRLQPDTIRAREKR
jgi:3-methyladenine DNA glycosylase/8-oxoguanine DNA glycosylase